MDARRVLPYVIGLIVLAFALGSLPRASAGGSLLFRSYWLLYLVYLGPVLVLAAMITLVIIIAMNWRDIGTGIGFGMARRRKMRKRSSLVTLLVSGLMWAIAIGYLISTGKGIFGNSQLKEATATQIVGESANAPDPFQGVFTGAISALVQSSWFGIIFLALLALGGLVVVQAVRVSLQETSLSGLEMTETKIASLQAVNEAIKLMNDERTDPRSRIISSFQRLTLTVSRLGTLVSHDMTARELEQAINSTFGLEGEATRRLTELFEEARYSLHEMTDEDAIVAQHCLESIAEELKVQLRRPA